MLYLSKSKYCQFWQCPKLAWLSKYKPEVQEISEDSKNRMETGNAVGDFAMGLFGEFVEATTYDETGKLDLTYMINKTQEEIAKGTEVICEASFSYEGFYCAVDILRKDGDGYSIYEVKSSSTSLADLEIKPVYIADISYQKYVLEHCGINVTGTYLVTLNKDYVLEGELDLSGLFNVIEVSEYVIAEISNVERNLANAKMILCSEVEPEIELSNSCNKPYKCPFIKYCMRDIPKPSVFDLYKKRFDSMLKLYRKGIVTYSELYDSGEIKNDKQLRQIDYYLHEHGTYAEREKIREFLGDLSYPLYFLDFETMQLAVPIYSGTKPYRQIPFQYSLHFIEMEGGLLQHKEFLATSGEDPRRAIAEALCRDIPMNVCVTAYNKSFECDRIKELASDTSLFTGIKLEIPTDYNYKI